MVAGETGPVVEVPLGLHHLRLEDDPSTPRTVLSGRTLQTRHITRTERLGPPRLGSPLVAGSAVDLLRVSHKVGVVESLAAGLTTEADLVEGSRLHRDLLGVEDLAPAPRTAGAGPGGDPPGVDIWRERLLSRVTGAAVDRPVRPQVHLAQSLGRDSPPAGTYLEFVVLRSAALAAGETPPVVGPPLLTHLLRLEHRPTAPGTALGLVGGLDEGGIREEGRRGWSDDLSKTMAAVKLSSMEVSCESGQELGADATLVTSFVVLPTSCNVNH